MSSQLITLFQPKLSPEDQEALQRENQARYLGGLSAGNTAGYLSAAGGEMLGRNAVGLAGTLAGVDMRSDGEKRRDAVARAKEEVSKLGINPDDPASIDEFYRRVIQILQKQGLVAEALAVAKEYREQKLARERGERADRDLARKEAYGNAQIELQRERLAKLGPETAQLVDRLSEIGMQLERTEAGTPQHANLTMAFNAIKARLQQLGGGTKVKVVDLNDRVELYDAATGDMVRVINKGVKPGASGGVDGAQKMSASERERARLIELEEKANAGTITDQEKRELELLQAKVKGGRPDEGSKMTDAQVKDITFGVVSVRTFAELAQSFRPSFSGGLALKVASATGLEDAASLVRRFAETNPAASAWWQRYFTLIAHIRNALFGASLTEGESRAFQQIKAALGDNPKLVLQIMKQQANEALLQAKTRAEAAQAAGYNIKNLPALLQAAESMVQSMPTTVRSAPSAAAPAAAPAARPAPSTSGWGIRKLD